MKFSFSHYNAQKKEYVVSNSCKGIMGNAYLVDYINMPESRSKTLQVWRKYRLYDSLTDKVDCTSGNIYISLYCGYIVKLVSGESALINKRDTHKNAKNNYGFEVIILDGGVKKEKRKIFIEDILWEVCHWPCDIDVKSKEHEFNLIYYGEQYLTTTVLYPYEVTFAKGYSRKVGIAIYNLVMLVLMSLLVVLNLKGQMPEWMLESNVFTVPIGVMVGGFWIVTLPTYLTDTYFKLRKKVEKQGGEPSGFGCITWGVFAIMTVLACITIYLIGFI